MDRYVVVVTFNLESDGSSKDYKGLQTAKQIYDKLKEISASKYMTDVSPMPACSLSGKPVPQKWFFSLQACCGSTQFCSSEWEELVESSQKSDSEEVGPSALEACLTAVEEQEEQTEQPSIKELLEEAADGLHLLADKLPLPGRSLLDVIFLCVDKEAPTMKHFLPLVGSLKHMQSWHSAKMTMVTEHREGWQKEALYLMARVCDSRDVLSCLDEREVWRGAVLIREKKMASEVRFEGFCLKRIHARGSWSVGTHGYTDHQLPGEVFHYYQPTLNLVQLVLVSDLPVFSWSSTEFELGLVSRSTRARMLLDQLATLRGKVAALFSLSCVVSALAMPSASQLSTHRWKEFMAKRPKALSVPEVEVKGEMAHYFLLVQGTAEGGCRARMIHSANQMNGAAALETVNALMRRNDSPSSGQSTVDWLRSLPCIRGDELLRQEKCLAKVQTLVLKECLSRREEAQMSAAMPASHLWTVLSLAREQFFSMQPTALSKGSPSPQAQEQEQGQGQEQEQGRSLEDSRRGPTSAWPERSVLHNYEKLRSRRQKSRSGILASSSESLMAPKDVQRDSSSLLDATELLKYFTPEGQPIAPLQPLLLLRGENAFLLSPNLTPKKVSQLPFRKATRSHYHGIEFCLDELGALERDRGMVRLQARLIRYETHTTCSKEPCPIPFALSPAPSPAVLSEPGSVPDGESLAQVELPRLKRHARDPDHHSYPHKRLAKSESGEGPGSHSSTSSGFGPLGASRALRQQTRPQSTSGASRSTARGATESQEEAPPQQSQKPTEGRGESRSQKHYRMLKEVVMKTLKQHGISGQHQAFEACSQRLFEISKFYLKDLKTSRGLHEEMKKAASSNAKQVIDWVLEKASKT